MAAILSFLCATCSPLAHAEPLNGRMQSRGILCAKVLDAQAMLEALANSNERAVRAAVLRGDCVHVGIEAMVREPTGYVRNVSILPFRCGACS